MGFKPHFAINVKDLERSISFYTNLFGVPPVKVKPRYAKFDVQNPALNFTLNEGGEVTGGINHFGIQVASTQEVLQAKGRLQQSGLVTFDEMNTNCCYARQDKIWVTSPDGHPWEVFTVLEDIEQNEDLTTCCPAEEQKEETSCGCPE
ncbi:ArsI/CadI family heavy metal resistance metalloenzyme [Thermoactinomyces sp. DSM 45892]|uniref:ArsI/CadI family heavy metal resistance metalloenzyme n=1 Tax=Thermoactinomyces sp. DSM 45892 TaxID=1882753 RepID=UPI00089AE1A8|nr:ArsI/CadI family heavy metal resistance metalloenzyme [Thermoactinomyces sp. DSM 45892]SDZ34350.1 Catechol 2,3-dioxygenase [Thermoactinomyces sp. DSM 45892]